MGVDASSVENLPVPVPAEPVGTKMGSYNGPERSGVPTPEPTYIQYRIATL